MIIMLSPMRSDAELTVTRQGSILTINGGDYDLADPNMSCPWIIDPPVLSEQQWSVSLMFPHGANAPQETLFPEPVFQSGDGPVALPPHDLPPPAEITET